MQPVECAVIAAAGLGSRLGHRLPKCMLEIGGRTLLSRMISTLENHVSRIHVVVGYREDLVINLCTKFHRQVVIVRNPEYRTTNTVRSMAIGARGLAGKTLFLDGDLIVDPTSLSGFMAEATRHSILAGICHSNSENPVNVDLVDGTGGTREMLIGAFSRETGRAYEWANVVSAPPRTFDDAVGYAFERLEQFLPLHAHALNLREVDTPADLERAKEFARAIDGEE